jgi:hypothetical protein
MTCTEDQFRSALRTVAADISASSLAPLALPDDRRAGPSRIRAATASPRGRRWLVPLGAAAAVTAIVAAAAIIGSAGTTSRPGSTAPRLWHGVPAYYLLVSTGPYRPVPAAVVRETGSGATVATVSLGRRCGFDQVSAAADDRTFALACEFFAKKGQAMFAARLFVARFDPATDRLSVRALHLPQIPNFQGVAMSQDGTKIAVVSFASPVRVGVLPTMTVRVYSVTTGTARIWSGVGVPAVFSQGGMHWGPGPLLAFSYYSYNTRYFHWYQPGPASGIRLLNTNAPSGSLVGASRLVVASRHLPGGYVFLNGFAISGNGATIATVLTGQYRHVEISTSSEFAEFSLATGKLLRLWRPAPYEDDQVLWSDRSGKTLVAQALLPAPRGSVDPRLGVLAGDRFTPLRYQPVLMIADEPFSDIAF